MQDRRVTAIGSSPPATGDLAAARVLFCAGAGADPRGALYQALLSAGYEVLAPDYRGLDVATAADILMYQILDKPQQPQILVGHSFGGAVALLAVLQAARKGATVSGMVLCAPAIFLAQAVMAPGRLPCPAAPTVLLHGVRDEAIPITLSREFAREHDLPLVEVSDDHRLRGSFAAVLEAVAAVGRSA